MASHVVSVGQNTRSRWIWMLLTQSSLQDVVHLPARTAVVPGLVAGCLLGCFICTVLVGGPGP